MNNLNVIQAINESPFKVFFAITGGGQTFIGDYMSVSGASKTVIGTLVPYSSYVFDKFVKWPVESYASEKAARQLAVAAYNECIEAGIPPKYAVGIGATCSLAKDNEREGRQHRVYVAAHMHGATRVYCGQLKQGRTRQQEEEYAAGLILHVLNVVTVNSPLTVPPAFDSYSVADADGRVYATILDKPDTIILTSKFDDEHSTRIIYPGSWNPLHDGHRQIIKMAEKILGSQVILEMSLRNADKGQLDHLEIDHRRNMVSKEYALALTNAPTFVEKAAKFRRYFNGDKLIFVVGADTWNRIWDSKYAGPPAAVEYTLEEYNVKFLVFGRGNIPIYQGAGERLRIKSLEASSFDMNVSSTDLRKK